MLHLITTHISAIIFTISKPRQPSRIMEMIVSIRWFRPHLLSIKDNQVLERHKAFIKTPINHHSSQLHLAKLYISLASKLITNQIQILRWLVVGSCPLECLKPQVEVILYLPGRDLKISYSPQLLRHKWCWCNRKSSIPIWMNRILDKCFQMINHYDLGKVKLNHQQTFFK